MKISDGSGLYLLRCDDRAWHGWRFDYRFLRRPKTLWLGTYPDTRVKLARTKAAAARELLTTGRDPGADRPEMK